MKEQLRLFPERDVVIKVKIYSEEVGFRAEIAGGWWMARGKTKGAAVKNVIKRYESEII